MTHSDIVERMQAASAALERNEFGARETLLDLNRELLAELETPTDFLQRLYFATVSFNYLLQLLLVSAADPVLPGLPVRYSGDRRQEKHLPTP